MSRDNADISGIVLNNLHMAWCASRKGSKLGGHADHTQQVVCSLVNGQAIQLFGLPRLVPGVNLDTVLDDDDDLVSGEAHGADWSLGGDESHCLVLHSIPDDDLYHCISMWFHAHLKKWIILALVAANFGMRPPPTRAM